LAFASAECRATEELVRVAVAQDEVALAFAEKELRERLAAEFAAEAADTSVNSVRASTVGGGEL
jgi:hypothetical protein